VIRYRFSYSNPRFWVSTKSPPYSSRVREVSTLGMKPKKANKTKYIFEYEHEYDTPPKGRTRTHGLLLLVFSYWSSLIGETEFGVLELGKGRFGTVMEPAA
jgi:hypothetical protein